MSHRDLDFLGGVLTPGFVEPLLFGGWSDHVAVEALFGTWHLFEMRSYDTSCATSSRVTGNDVWRCRRLGTAVAEPSYVGRLGELEDLFPLSLNSTSTELQYLAISYF